MTDKFQGQHLVILDGIEVVGQTPDHDNGPYNRTETLQSVTMPDTVKSIEWKTFEHCAKLKAVRLSANLESMGAAGGGRVLQPGRLSHPPCGLAA